MIPCSKCTEAAVTFIRYNGTHLCKNHFIQYFERRVKKDIKKQGKTSSPARLGIALSGGKDSVITLHLINEIFGIREGIEILAFSVDEGIKGYREGSIKIAKKNCEALSIPHYTVSFTDEIGLPLDEILKNKNKEIGACGYCGVFRRFCLNRIAKSLDVSQLITGHNLDDMAQSILMNFVNADTEKLARLGPHTKIQPGLIPRIMPLRTIPEKENALYAILQGIVYHDGVCPYSEGALRGIFQDIIYELEDRNPGTRHSIFKSYDNIKELLIDKYPPTMLRKCQICKEPTTQTHCKTCELRKKLSLL